MLSITMLTPYRIQGAAEMSGSADSALNWYSGRLVHELLRVQTRTTVVGPRLLRARPSSWDDGGVEVHSAFVRGALNAVWQAGGEIVRLPQRVVHIQHELFAFGGLVSALMLPAMMKSLRRRGFKLVTTLHGVIPLVTVSDDFVKTNRIPGNAATARVLWRTLLRHIALASDVVHVHEHFLRDLLESDYEISTVPLRVIPLGIDAQERHIDAAQARGRLGIPQHAEVALFFGYLSAYKGIEYLFSELPAMLSERPNLHVVIAGAVPARLAGRLDPHAIVDQLDVGKDRVHVRGFVSDGDTAAIFASADVVLLPYRVMMSASGPLALASGFNVPALLSKAFESSFPQAPNLFELNPGGLTKALRRFFGDPVIRARSRDFTQHIRATRSWAAMAGSLTELYRQLSCC